MYNSAKDREEDGREEGEIVDSDEEQNMRQRIKELEAKNDELEKIASISGDYTNQYHYATEYGYKNSRILGASTKQRVMSQKDVARIPSDASSISSDEMEPVKRRIKRKGRSKKKENSKKFRSRSHSLHKHNNNNNNNRVHKVSANHNCRKHNRLRLQKLNSPILINDNYLETISLDSDEDLDRPKSISSRSDYEGKDIPHYLNRDELRFALARDRIKDQKKTNRNLLRERLNNGNCLIEHKENINTCELVANSLDGIKTNGDPMTEHQHHHSQGQHTEKDECATQEEQELRLIALKSAILKKHIARKKRNAEMAYSPTDFAPVTANLNITDDNMDVVEEELDELNDVMEISPINSPKLVLSPTNDCEVIESNFKDAVDNKSIDMDIADSGSEEDMMMIMGSAKKDQWFPIENAPLTTEPNELNNVLKYPLPIHYGIYVPEMQYQVTPPNIANERKESTNIEKLYNLNSSDTYENFIFDDEPAPPPPSMYMKISSNDEDSIPAHINNIISENSSDEQAPPPPPFFRENGLEESGNNIFQRLGEKTEETPYDLTNLHNEDEPSTEIKKIKIERHDYETNAHDVHTMDENRDSDEEASALRAVLLSKLQTSKFLKKEKKDQSPKQQDSEQSLAILDIESNAVQEQMSKNGVESILQKALRRLKSNFTSSYSWKENDAIRAMKIKTESMDSPSPELDVNNPVQGTEAEPKSTTTGKSRILKRLKSIGSKSTSNLAVVAHDCTTEIESKDEEEPSTQAESTIQTIVESTNDNECGQPVRDENEASNNSVTKTEENKEPNEIQSLVKCNQNQENTCKEKQNEIKPPTAKIPSSSEKDNKQEQISLKRKVLNPVATAQVQPLSVKNGLIPAKISSLKSAQNFLQSTLNKVRTTRTTKIVKPNKVINKNITTNIKRAMTPSGGSPTPPAKIQRTNENTSTNSKNSTNLVAETPPKIIVKKLIIQLRASDTETSDDELMKNVHVPMETVVDRLKNSYGEISSPFELIMDSASCSPARMKSSSTNNCNSNSIPLSSETPAAPASSTTNASFEQKLDAFLKGIRRKGSQDSITNQSPKASETKKIDTTANSTGTPSAVRHLPLASQDEYRRLVHRMKLLEKQKLSKKSDEEMPPLPASTTKEISIPNSTPKTTESKKVADENESNSIKRNAQLKTLLSLELSYDQTSDNIVKLLNKSLCLVAEAKKSENRKITSRATIAGIACRSSKSASTIRAGRTEICMHETTYRCI